MLQAMMVSPPEPHACRVLKNPVTYSVNDLCARLPEHRHPYNACNAAVCQLTADQTGPEVDTSSPMHDTTQNSIMQHIEDFIVGQLLPLLGPQCRTAAAIEATVSDELLGLHVANAQLGQRLTKW